MKQLTAETKALRKGVKRDGRRVAISVILFTLVPVLVFLLLQVGVLAYMHATGTALQSCEQADAILTELESLAYIFGPILAAGLTFLIFKKQKLHQKMFRSEKKMTFSTFAQLICVVIAADYILSAFFPVLEGLFNLIGLSPTAALAETNSIAPTATAFIAACIIAPIFEELTFRGFALRGLQKHGKILALTVSSILFGLVHGNPFHAISAFCAGLILGYVTMEYSLVWSIALHMVNNLVLCFVLPLLLGANAEAAFEPIALIATIISIIVLYARRNKIKTWIRNNLWKKPNMKWVLTSVLMVLLLAALTIMNIAAMFPHTC